VAGYLFENKTNHGFTPLHGTFSGSELRLSKMQSFEVDSLKELYLRKFIQMAKSNNCRLIITISPVYKILQAELKVFDRVKILADHYDIPVFDLSQDSLFLTNKMLFKDFSHLNYDGAVLLSELLSLQINALISNGRKTEDSIY
jgi:hypothetical protein